MDKKPVSIVVITSNEANNIKKCLDSLLKLEYPRFEIVVIDHSTDSTPEIVSGYRQVRLIKSSKGGFPQQRNKGIQSAKYGLIAFTDADCVVPKDWLDILVSSLNKSIVAAGGNAFSPPDSPFIGKCIACLGFPAGGDLGLDAISTPDKDGNVKSIATCNALFRKSALKNIMGFNEKLKYGGEDTGLCSRLRKNGGKIKYIKESYIFHKTRDSIKDFVKWCCRRGIAKYYTSSGYIFPVTALLLAFLAFLAALFLSPFLAISSIIIAFIASAALTLFTKKFRILIKRRKKIGISLLSIIFVVSYLALLRHISMMYGFASEFAKKRILRH